jgi:hypothetical protein
MVTSRSTDGLLGDFEAVTKGTNVTGQRPGVMRSRNVESTFESRTMPLYGAEPQAQPLALKVVRERFWSAKA